MTSSKDGEYMKNTAFFLQKARRYAPGRRSHLFWRIICVMILMVGVCTLSLALPLSAHAATSDCHIPSTAPGDAYELTSASFTILANGSSTASPTTRGTLNISLFYCPAFQSVFGRFVFTSIDGVPLAGTCEASDDTNLGPEGIGVQSGCTDGLPDGQSIDTQIISASGDSWHASWTNQQFPEIPYSVFCQGSDGFVSTVCSTPSVATPTS
jgi:hypothetical protein